MSSQITLVTKSANNSATTSTHRTGDSVRAKSNTVYELLVDNKPAPKGTKVTRESGRVKFTFPDGSHFEMTEWEDVSCSIFTDLIGVLGYSPSASAFVEIASFESGTAAMTNAVGESLCALGAPANNYPMPIVGGVLGAGLIGALAGGGGSAQAAPAAAAPTANAPTAALKTPNANNPNGNVTGNNHPEITGKSVAGDRISVKLPSGEVLTTTADANGNWSVTPVGAMPDGEAQLLITATTPNGTVSPPTNLTIIVDTTAPNAPRIVAITESADGIVDAAEANAGTHVVLSLEASNAKVGDTITLNWGGQAITHVLTQAEVDAGTLTIEVPPELIAAQGNGQVPVTISIVDMVGNASAPGPATNALVVTGRPTAAPDLMSSSDSGASSTDNLTNDNTPSITIDAPGLGFNPVLIVDGVVVAAVISTVNGAIELVPVVPLSDGPHAIAVAYVDVAGVQSPASPSLNIVIDTQIETNAPSAPVLTAASDTGASNSDAITSVHLPSFQIAAPPAGQTPRLYIDGVLVPSAYDAVAGTLTPVSPLASGVHNVSVANIDAAGNETPKSAAQAVTIVDAPAAPSAAIDMLAVSDSGASNTDNLTNQNQPQLSITPPVAGLTPRLYVDGVAVAATFDAATGTLVPTAPLANGNHALTYTLTNAAGLESPASPALDIVIDRTAPAQPAAPDLAASSDSGVSNVDDITGDNKPTIIVATLAAGETATLFVDGVAVVATWDATTHSLTPTVAIAAGPHQFSFTVTDAAGNTSVRSPDLAVTIEPAPASPTTAVDLLASSDSGASNTDNLTNIVTPTFAIAAPAAGFTPTLYIDGVAVAATFNPATNSFTLPADMTPGLHAITYTVTNTAGGESGQSPVLNVTIDTQAPNAPAAPDMTAATDSGASNTDNITSNALPAFAVAAPGPGNTPILYVDGNTVAATWDPVALTLTPVVALTDGPHNIATTLVDAAGNQSTRSSPLAIVVDSARPKEPALSPDMTGATDSGASDTDNVTNVTSPVFEIAPPPAGMTPKLYIDGVATAATFDAATNAFTLPAGMTPGLHTITYTLTNLAGSESVQSPVLDITIDTQAPNAPASAPDMTAATDTGASSADNITANASPAFAVTAPVAGNTPKLYVDGVAVAATWDPVTLTLTPVVALTNGPHNIATTLVDAAGNESPRSSPLAIQIDTAKPAAPTLSPDLTAASDSGVSNTDDVTNIVAPTFAIAAPAAGFTPTLYIDGLAVAATFNAASNTFTLPVDMTPGPHAMTYTLTNAAGSESAQSPVLNVTIDTQAPTAPASAPDMTAATDSGFSDTDNITANDTPAFAVTAPGAGNTPKLYVDGVLVAATWDPVALTLTPSAALTNGPHNITTILVDAAGNESPRSGPLAIQIDTARPAAPSLSPDLTAATDSGSSNTDNVTNIVSPTFAIAAPAAGMTPTLYIDGVAVAAMFDAATNSFTLPNGLTPSVHAITYTLTNAAGSESAASPVLNVTIDTQAPKAPASPPDMTAATDSGLSNTDNITANPSPAFAVAAPGPGNLAKLYVDGVAVAAVWDPVALTLTPVVALTNGPHNIATTLVDAAGNEGPSSGVLAIEIDTTRPAAPALSPDLTAATDSGVSDTDNLTNILTPTFAIAAPAAGFTPKLYIDGNAVAATFDAATNSFALPTNMTPGLHAITYTLTNLAGTESALSPTLNVTIDTQAPNAPASAPDMTAATDLGASNTDNLTANSTPAFAVAAPGAGNTPTLYVDGVLVEATWDPVALTLTPTAPLTNGPHSITTKLVDAAGNESPRSAALSIQIDAAPPAAPLTAPDLTAATDSGVSNTDNFTNVDKPVFAIAAPAAGFTPTLYIDGVAVTATFNAATNSFTLPVAMTPGLHAISYTLTNLAGGQSAQSPALNVTIDTQAPSAPASAPDMTAATDLGASSTDNITANPLPAFAVAAPGAGNTPKLYVDGTAVAATWDPIALTLTPTVALTNGPHNISTTLVDAAGNESPQSAALAIQIDTSKPAAPLAAPDLTAATDSGVSNTDNLTNFDKPTFAITAPPAGFTPTLYIDGVATAAVFDAATNSFALPTSMTPGLHAISYTLTNTAGGQSNQSPALNVTIDTQAPNAPAAAPDMTAATDTGASNTDNITSKTQPAFAVAAPGTGNTLKLYVDGVAVAAAWDPIALTLTPSVALTNGPHSISTTLVDAAGNESPRSASLAIEIDTIRPAAPVSPDMTAATDTGTSSVDNTTSNTKPSFAVGTPASGETPTLYVDGVAVASAFDPITNTLTPTVALTPGAHSITSTITDAAGNQSLPSSALAITVDIAAPTLISSSPGDNAINVFPSNAITLNYSEPVALGSGNQTITLYNFTTGLAVETFNVTTGLGDHGGTITVAGSAVTLNLGAPTSLSTHYDIQTSPGAVADIAGNAAPTISTNSGLDFTTATPAATITVTNLASTTYSKYLHTVNPNLTNTNALGREPGTNNFGTEYFRGVDDASATVSVTAAFGPTGINYFGTNYTNIGIGSNGYITFGHTNNSYDAVGIPGYTNGGMIAVQFDDWWAQNSSFPVTAGGTNGNSTGANATYFDAYKSAGLGVVTLTYDDVGYFNRAAVGITDGLTTNDYTHGNAEQIRLVATATGEIVIQLVYENVSWINGNTGLPTAGWTKGDSVNYGIVDGNIPGASTNGISGTNNFLDVERASNVGIAGVFEWVIGADGKVGSGVVPMIDTHDTSGIQLAAQINATGTATTYAQDAMWDSRFTLVGNKIQANAGAVFSPTETSVDLVVQVRETATGLTYPKTINVLLFDQIGVAGNDEIGIRSAADITKLTSAVVTQVVMNGNAGEDTLVFTGTGLNLNLTSVQDTALINVERVNLGSGNTLTLSLADVFAMSSANQFNSSNGWAGLGASVTAEQVVIDGNATDSVTVFNRAQWTQTSAGSVTNGGHTYLIYNNIGNTGQLLIDENVPIIWG